MSLAEYAQRRDALWTAVDAPAFTGGTDAARAVLAAFRMTKPYAPRDRDLAALVLSPPEWWLDDAAPIIWC